METMSKDFDVGTIRVCAGSCCAVCGVFWECPAAFGCGANYELCCFTYDFCCKPCGGPPAYGCTAPEGRMCRLGICCCAIGLKKPDSCCRSSVQSCCIISIGAIPCDETVPCVIGHLGLTCYPIFGCCLPLSEIPNAKKKISPK